MLKHHDAIQMFAKLSSWEKLFHVKHWSMLQTTENFFSATLLKFSICFCLFVPSAWWYWHQQCRYAFECSTHLDFQLKSFQWYLRSHKKIISKCHCCWGFALHLNDGRGEWCWCFLMPKTQKYLFIDSWNQASIIDMTSYFRFPINVVMTVAERVDRRWYKTHQGTESIVLPTSILWSSLATGYFSVKLQFSINIIFNENIFLSSFWQIASASDRFRRKFLSKDEFITRKAQDISIFSYLKSSMNLRMFS